MSSATIDTPIKTSPAIEKRVEALLKGSIDIHCHSGPSVMPRCLDHIDALEEASSVGMRALLFKDHYYSATPITENPRGLRNSEASLARNLFAESPAETVMPTSASTRAAMRASAMAGNSASMRCSSARSR